MADTWFYAKGTTRQGPVTLDQLRALIASNQVLMTDNVWREGMANWAPASTVPELAGAVAAPAAMPPQITPPPTPTVAGGPPPTPGSHAPAASIPLSQRPEVWDKNQQTLRIMLIIAAGIAFLMFFTPQFYRLLPSAVRGASRIARDFNINIDADLWSGYPRIVWGWSTWFGITVFILSFFAAGAAVADLLLRKIPIVPFIMQWVHLGLFGLMGLLMLIGTILGIFGIGTSGGYAYCIPITSILSVLALAAGTTIAVMIITKHRVPMPRTM